MKSRNLLLPTLVLGLSTTLEIRSLSGQESAQDSVQRELDRVGELLGQLQASGILKPGSAPGPDSLPQLSNPFSDLKIESTPGTSLGAGSGRVPTTASTPTPPPGVEIGPDAIRIQIGEQAFRVPRVASSRAPAAATANEATKTFNVPLGSFRSSALDKAALYSQLGYALSDFKKGQYEQAKSRLDGFRHQIADEPIVAQSYALILFQNGDFSESAAWAYESLRASRPWDWDALRGLYGEAQDYAARYEQLQTRSAAQPDQIQRRFLLAYHHLMLGHQANATRELQSVKQSIAEDPVVQRLTELAQQSTVKPPMPLAN